MMIGDEQLAVTINPEASDVERRVGEQLVPRDFGSIVANSPNAAGRVVAIDVSTRKFGQFRAMINDTARERTGFAVMMIGNGRRQWLRPHLSVGIKDVAAFVDAPAEIRALGDEVNLLP